MEFSSYWISPWGEIIEIEDHPVKRIVREPALFGYEYDELQMIYTKYSDRNEMKGEATKAVISDLVQKGWIYCYLRNNGNEWSIELYKLDKQTRPNLLLWVTELYRKNVVDDSTNLRIHRHYKKTKHSKTIGQILEGDYFK
ncbi:MAG: hypothetical protein WCX83_05845 [Candidatus Cloacimonas sp.]|nr:hypothetical protein [Candidatus Cloacimonadota bacterium]